MISSVEAAVAPSLTISSPDSEEKVLLPKTIDDSAITVDNNNNSNKIPIDWKENTSFNNAIIMSCSFFLTFCALNASQNYATTPEGNVGPTAVSILYVVLTICNLLSSGIVLRFGTKNSLIFGSFTYIGYVFANIFFKPWIMYPTAALLGLGGAVLWTAEGVYITMLSVNHDNIHSKTSDESSLGYFNGIFFSIFQCAQFIGNLLVAVLFTLDMSPKTIFSVGTGVAIFGTILMTFIKSVPSTKIQARLPTVKENLISMLQLANHSSMKILLFVFLFSGNYQGFIYSAFPNLMNSHSKKFYVLAGFGASDAISSMLMGKLSDRIGRWPVLWIGIIAHSSVFITILLYDVKKYQNYTVFSILAILLGIADGVFNTQIYAILSSLYPNDTEPAFANLKFWQSLAIAAAFFYSKRISTQYIVIILIALLAISVLCLASLRKLDKLR